MSAHHPDDIILLDYAAGSLSIPEALAVSVHLYFCGHCRTQLKKLNSIGGVLLENAKPATLDDDGFEALMQKIEHAPMSSPQGVSMHEYSNPLARLLPAPLADVPWHQQTREIGKFDLTKLLQVTGFQVALQKIAAGAKVPTHTHKGTELTVILSGGFSDELGVYHTGDFIARDASHKHSPTALQNEDCICLTVLDAPIKFTGWQRIFNPFMS